MQDDARAWVYVPDVVMVGLVDQLLESEAGGDTSRQLDDAIRAGAEAVAVQWVCPARQLATVTIADGLAIVPLEELAETPVAAWSAKLNAYAAELRERLAVVDDLRAAIAARL